MFKSNPAKSIGREILEWILVIVIAFAAAFVIRRFFFQMVVVEGKSMDYTLAEGDRLFVWSFNYTPENGDVVVFNPFGDESHPYIKRVIATEGQSIYIDEDGKVFVDGKELNEDYLGSPTDHGIGFYTDSSGKPVEIYDKSSVLVQPTEDEPYVVPEGCVFAMGDNRAHSRDCRDIGPVSLDDVVGEAVFRIYPFGKFGTLN